MYLHVCAYTARHLRFRRTLVICVGYLPSSRVLILILQSSKHVESVLPPVVLSGEASLALHPAQRRAEFSRNTTCFHLIGRRQRQPSVCKNYVCTIYSLLSLSGPITARKLVSPETRKLVNPGGGGNRITPFSGHLIRVNPITPFS